MQSELSQLGAAHRLEHTEGDANEAESGSARRRSTSTHLLRLAAALVLPVLVFAGVLAWYYVVAQRERIDESALSAARELSTAVDPCLAPISSCCRRSRRRPNCSEET